MFPSILSWLSIPEIIALQRDDARNEKNTRFLGLINKVDYVRKMGTLTIQPRFKSERLKDNVPYSIMGEEHPERDQFSGSFFLIVKFPALRKTRIELGLEQQFFWDLVVEEKNLSLGDLTKDFRNAVFLAQLANVGAYQGYSLITHLGLRIARSSRERVEAAAETQAESFVYLTMYAGLKR